jgi:hypothetical protein
MNDRLVTAAGALLALLIVYAMFFQKEQPAPYTRPLSTETGRNGYSALRSWLEAGGVTVVGLTQRFDRLLDADEPLSGPGDAPRGPGDALRGAAETLRGAGQVRGLETLSAAGNVLITTVPHRFVARVGEASALRRWIRDGNTLLVMAALNDTPEWVGADARTVRTHIGALTGVAFSVHRPDDGDDGAREEPLVPAGARVEFRPVAHPLMEGVERLGAVSDEASAIWLATDWDRRRPLLRLADEAITGIAAVWQQPAGDGHVIVVSSAALLANHAVADSDAGRFVANVLRHHLGAGGTVIFDDMHQGLSSLYDPAAFYGDPRLHATLLFLVGGWLAWLLGSSSRLTPPGPPRAAPRHGDFLAAAGGLLARRLDRRNAGLLMLEDGFNEIRRARGLPAGGVPP